MIERLAAALENDPRIAYALLFGSRARGRPHPHSDVDVAVGLSPDARLTALQVGALVARIESAAGVAAHLVLLHEAPPGLAYRVFRDGRLLFSRDDGALAERKARAILEYLDFRPIEEMCARAVLAARDGR